MFGIKRKNRYKNQKEKSYKAPLIGALATLALVGGVYTGKNLSQMYIDEKEEAMQKEDTRKEFKHTLRENITKDTKGVFLDDILNIIEEKKDVLPKKEQEYDEKKLDYSSIKELDPFLQDKVVKTLEENILSEKWVSQRYARMFTSLSKFDDMLIDSRNYALLVQEIGPYLLTNNRLPKSRAGASGYGQLMASSKIENNIISDGIVDESYHPIKGIEAAMQHHKRYNFENILPQLNKNISLDLAVYNFGYGNVMNSLAQIIEDKGKDPNEIFRYSGNAIMGIKDHEKLDNMDINYKKFSKKIPLETRNYIENVNALSVFMDNALEGRLEGIEIKKQPLFSELFEERMLGEGNYLYSVWENEAKDKGITWQIYSDVVNMHIQDNSRLRPDNKILVPSEKIPADYF